MKPWRPLFLPLLFFLSSAFLTSEPLVHVLEKGETIFGVARKYSVPYEAVIAVNRIEDPRRVFPGTRLVIPASHKVEKGQTLYGIARTYGVALEELRRVNKLGDGALIKPGDILVLPENALPSGSASQPQSPAPASAPGGSPERPAAPGKAAPGTPAKTSAKPVPAATWPAEGEASYLDGKLFGVGIRTREKAPIRAVRSGTVVSAGPFRGFGRVAFIQAKDGLIYVYGGAETLGVRIGESVRAGSEIGKVGIDLKEGLPIAYFLVFKKGNALDPATVPRE